MQPEDAPEHVTPGTVPRLRRSRTKIIGAVLLALVLPTVALGSHLFSDVPDTHTFHGSIANLANAGITGGCGAGKYCPASPVTRGQMAAFLNRGMGRIAEADFQKSITGTASTTVGSFSITPGGVGAGATQFLRAEFTGTVRFSNVTSCPCSVAVYLTADGAAFTSFASATTLSVTNQYASLSTSGVLPISGPAPVEVSLVAYMVTGGAAATAYTVFANVDAETFPFGSTGGETLSAEGAFSDDPLAVPRD